MFPFRNFCCLISGGWLLSLNCDAAEIICLEKYLAFWFDDTKTRRFNVYSDNTTKHAIKKQWNQYIQFSFNVLNAGCFCLTSIRTKKIVTMRIVALSVCCAVDVLSTCMCLHHVYSIWQRWINSYVIIIPKFSFWLNPKMRDYWNVHQAHDDTYKNSTKPTFVSCNIATTYKNTI